MRVYGVIAVLFAALLAARASQSCRSATDDRPGVLPESSEVDLSNAIVLERSPEVTSPDGRLRVALSSTTNPDPSMSLTQVVWSRGMVGGGLIAIGEARVDMALRWEGSALIVAYPDHLAPTRPIDEKLDGRAGDHDVRYEAVPADQIPPLTWTQHTVIEAGPVATQRERGTITEIVQDGERRFAYDYYDVYEQDSHYDILAARGLQGGGPSWAGIAHGLLMLRAPSVAGRVALDPEGDGMRIWAARREDLETIAALIAEAKTDPALLDAAIERATRDGQME